MSTPFTACVVQPVPLPYDKEGNLDRALAWMEAAGLDEKIRGEALGIPEFAALADRLGNLPLGGRAARSEAE